MYAVHRTNHQYEIFHFQTDLFNDRVIVRRLREGERERGERRDISESCWCLARDNFLSTGRSSLSPPGCPAVF